MSKKQDFIEVGSLYRTNVTLWPDLYTLNPGEIILVTEIKEDNKCTLSCNVLILSLKLVLLFRFYNSGIKKLNEYFTKIS